MLIMHHMCTYNTVQVCTVQLNPKLYFWMVLILIISSKKLHLTIWGGVVNEAVHTIGVNTSEAQPAHYLRVSFCFDSVAYILEG